MKTIILTFGTIIAFMAGSTLFTSCGSGSQKEADTSEQHDMDNDHDHDHDDTSIAAVFACPMHPEITGKEGEKCSKCGMDLVASTSNANIKDMVKSALASCPMHPEITGKVGEKCSKCGMELVLADNGDDDHNRQH